MYGEGYEHGFLFQYTNIHYNVWGCFPIPLYEDELLYQCMGIYLIVLAGIPMYGNEKNISDAVLASKVVFSSYPSILSDEPSCRRKRSSPVCMKQIKLR